MNPQSKKPVVLAIGGLDPSGGAGILADIKTISAFGCYGLAAVTSITVQNTKGVLAAYHQPEQIVFEQITALLDDFEISAFKTGMLPTAEIVAAVGETLKKRPGTHVVVDPIFKSTSGFDLAEQSANALGTCIFPLASIVTPNAREASRLTGIDVVDEESMSDAGRKILAMGPRAVLVKGGDLTGAESIDLLVDEEGVLRLSLPKISSNNTHGTGCTLASAIAASLALGSSLRQAVRYAKNYVSAAIETAPDLGRGFGPLNHFPFGQK